VNVLEVYSSFLPKRGGVQRHMYDLCECMVQEGHKPIVLAWMPYVPSFEIIDGIKVNRVRMPRLFCFTRYPLILFLSLHMLRLTKRYNVDMLHAHDYLPGLAAVLAGFFLNKPVVVTFHLPIQTTTYLHFRISPLFLIEKVLKKCFVFWVSKIICVSKFTYRKTLSLDFPPSKLKVIYNWVKSTSKDSSRKDTLKEFNLDKKRYLLSIGRLEEHQKHFSMLISAFKLLLNKGYELELVIVGNGPDKEAYRKYASRLNVENHIHFLTNASDSNLDILYSECELFVLPSRLEGLPLVLLEAMNRGKPIVATKVGGIPEVVEEGSNGILVRSNYNDLASGIEEILSEPHIKDVFGKRSKEIIMEKFSERNCKSTIVFLEKLAKE
jgi:glycosyltransferase involved in cell wall biosynthesis